jgi:hypothetical protein
MRRREGPAHQAPAYNDGGTGAARPPSGDTGKVLVSWSKIQFCHEEHSLARDVEDALNQRAIISAQEMTIMGNKKKYLAGTVHLQRLVAMRRDRARRPYWAVSIHHCNTLS